MEFSGWKFINNSKLGKLGLTSGYRDRINMINAFFLSFQQTTVGMKNTLYLFLVLFGIIGCTPETERSESDDQPNILFLIADDWSYPHASIYGDPVVKTPTFDRIANEGALFHHAYTASPSCSPSRASILTGRYPHQNESAGNLWSVFPDKFPNYVSSLQENGYLTGSTRKGWGPGDYEAGGYKVNPAGKSYENFETFYNQKPDNQPFCFWFGGFDPHRDYDPNTGIGTGMKLEDVIVPGFLPDVPCVRNDILDYYFEVERFDRESGQILRFLEEKGELDNTLIVITSDNGMPFPRAKANLYDYGTRMPLAIRWPEKVKAGTIVSDFINFIDLAPTFLEAAGVSISSDMTGRSIIDLLIGQPSTDRDRVFVERERHANVRKGDLSYPMRAVRTNDYLYIRNYFPDRWPAGDPEVHRSVGQFGDIDNSISKSLIMMNEDSELYTLSYGKRPSEELYDVINDPYQLNNLAGDDDYGTAILQLREELQNWMMATADPRAVDPQTIYWDTVLYIPDYQHENFDLVESIKVYQVDPPLQDSFDCLQ